jgi:hypothetical protein
MDNSEPIEKSNPNLPPTPWETEIRRRWARFRGLIAESEHDLARAEAHDDRVALEASVRTLKRAALSVWVDARRAGIALPGTPEGQPSALTEG